MRRTLALVTILGGAWASVAVADGGGPSPGLDYGNGVVAPGGKLRYVALFDGRSTLVESIAVGSGKVMAARNFRGNYGIPLVTFGGDTGGLTRDGRRLVLATWPGVSTATRFMVVDPRSFKVRDRLRLRGRFAFDALSPDGSLMYLLQYLGAPGAPTQPYAVRAYDWKTRRLYPGAIVDRREPDEKMTGQAMTRTGTASGWAYTLYSRLSKPPFVHALDTVRRKAFCVDLPWKHSLTWIGRVRMRVRGGMLELRRDGRTIARVDRKTLEVER
jgi:hypothetical protein